MRIPNVLYAYLSGPQGPGTISLAAGVSNKKVRVLGYAFTAGGAVDFQLQDGAGAPLCAQALGIIGAGEQGDSVIPIGEGGIGDGLQVSLGVNIEVGLQVRYEYA